MRIKATLLLATVVALFATAVAGGQWIKAFNYGSPTTRAQ